MWQYLQCMPPFKTLEAALSPVDTHLLVSTPPCMLVYSLFLSDSCVVACQLKGNVCGWVGSCLHECLPCETWEHAAIS